MAAIKFDQTIPFTQNGRPYWATKLPVTQTLNIAITDHHGQQLNLFHITNREIEQRHANEFAKYLTTPNWALPQHHPCRRPRHRQIQRQKRTNHDQRKPQGTGRPAPHPGHAQPVPKRP